MGFKRTWDEMQSPQWRYLLSKDSVERKKRQKAEDELTELTTPVSKRKRKAQERHQEKRKLKTKSGKEIVYSASPGGEKNRYHNEEFEKSQAELLTTKQSIIDYEIPKETPSKN